MAELKVRIEPEDIVERVVEEVAYKGRTIAEWADALTNPKTNADRIRAMSDEELAEFMNHGACPPGEDVSELCYDEDEGSVSCWCKTLADMCTRCWLNWLREECKSED